MKVYSIAIALLMAASVATQAHLISEGETPQGGNSNPETEVGIAEGVVGVDLEFLYRFPTGEGDFDSYFTVVDNDDGTADVSWDLTGSGKELWAVGVKSGSKSINWYSVSEDQKLTSGGIDVVSAPTNPANGKMYDSISHISFFGRDFQETPPPQLPDSGTTTAMLGLGLLCLGAVGRRMKR